MNLHDITTLPLQRVLHYCIQYFPPEWMWEIRGNELWYQTGREFNEWYRMDDEEMAYYIIQSKEMTT